MRIRTCLLVLILALPAHSIGSWPKTDVAFQMVSATAIGMDWGQTLTINQYPNVYQECNPILGKHPSRAKINVYFALSTIGNYLIADMLPARWRRYYQMFVIGFEGYIIRNNASIGVKMQF